MCGEVEVDESYFGGVRKGKRGRGTAGKTITFGLNVADGRIKGYELIDPRTRSGKGMNWEEALAYAGQKNKENYLGYPDWHLPNAKSICDKIVGG